MHQYQIIESSRTDIIWARVVAGSPADACRMATEQTGYGADFADVTWAPGRDKNGWHFKVSRADADRLVDCGDWHVEGE